MDSSLESDIGAASPVAPAPGGLEDDLGISNSPKSSPEQSAAEDPHPVTNEIVDAGRHAVRGAITGLGKLADLPGDIWDMAFHPGEEPHPMAHLVAEKLADRLQTAVPQLKPKQNGNLGKDVEAGFDSAPTGLLGGPESLIPTMFSGAASQEAANRGYGPVGQTIAGLTPFAPAALAAGARGLVRGASGANMEANLAEAKNAGIDISAGQAAENPVTQSVETLSGKGFGGAPVKRTRGAGLNQQVEESVSNIVKKLAPDLNQAPPTPTQAGETIQAGIKTRVANLNEETGAARDEMEKAVGGKETPWAAPKLEAALAKITGSTGVESVDALVTGAKTKAISRAVEAAKPQTSPVSYSTDGEGAHVASSANGETHAVETAQGDLKVIRSDTAPEAQGKGEGTDRLEALANAATGKGKNLVSDVSVSPAEAAAYEKLGRKGWAVTKNPNAEINPDTGNLISDSPKNPVYTVKAPNTTKAPGQGTAPQSAETHFEGQWTYDPKTGKSEPVTSQNPATPAGAQTNAVLDQATPHTFDSVRSLRTLIGRGIKSTRDPGQQGQLKQLYGAVSEDLEDGVKAKGAEAEGAYGLFNSVAKQNAGTQKTLVKALKEVGGPEAAFKAAMSGSKDGATKISPIMQSLDSDGQNLFRATVLHRLGRAGGAADAPFDANTFLTNWKGMSPEAKNVLFNGSAPGNLRSSLDSLSNTLGLLKGQGYITSNLTKSVAQGVGHGGGNMVRVLTLGWMGEHGASAVYHIASGNAAAAAAAVGGLGTAVTAGPILSKVLTNPRTAAWLAQATKAPAGAIPVMLNQLNRMGDKDPDAKDLASLINQSQGETK